MEELSGALLPFERAFILARGCEWQIQEGSFFCKKGFLTTPPAKALSARGQPASIFRDGACGVTPHKLSYGSV